MASAGALLVAGAVQVSAAAATTSTATAAKTPTSSSPKKPADPTVEPNPASPGTRIYIYDANKCTAPHGTATSQALTAPIPLAPLDHMTGGDGTIRTGLPPGTYTITLHCGSTLTTTLHVTTTTTPTGAAATGDGSAEDHLGIGDAAVGSAFLLGGLTFATASLIRRRRATPHQ
jgi:hypothetical protein